MESPLLTGWDNFYVIVGSAAAGLTGLTFVVIALVREVQRVNPTGLGTFVTPTIVHFATVLALAAYLMMPGHGRASLSGGFVLSGAVGLAYSLFIATHLRNPAYAPVWEDWIWNAVLPTLAYALLLGMGLVIWRRPPVALYGVAGISLLLLFVGIHNAWDIAVWMTLSKSAEKKSEKQTEKKS
jgi:hypothetical protein